MPEKQYIHNREATLMFIRRWFKHPLRLGAIIPSSPALTKLVSRQVQLHAGKYVVELGGGTGRLTRTLLEAGIPNERLIVVELDKELCNYLRQSLPNATVIQGDACDLPKILPKKVVGNVSSVISGIPMTNIPNEIIQKIIDACLAVMSDDGEILQYTYRPLSPLAAGKLGLSKQRVGMTFRNLPPATVWRYKRAA